VVTAARPVSVISCDDRRVPVYRRGRVLIGVRVLIGGRRKTGARETARACLRGHQRGLKRVAD
jgi:hypothetical protein